MINLACEWLAYENFVSDRKRYNPAFSLSEGTQTSSGHLFHISHLVLWTELFYLADPLQIHSPLLLLHPFHPRKAPTSSLPLWLPHNGFRSNAAPDMHSRGFQTDRNSDGRWRQQLYGRSARGEKSIICALLVLECWKDDSWIRMWLLQTDLAPLPPVQHPDKHPPLVHINNPNTQHSLLISCDNRSDLQLRCQDNGMQDPF